MNYLKKIAISALFLMIGLTCLHTQSVQAGLVTVSDKDLMRNGSRLVAKGMNYYPKDFAWKFWKNYNNSDDQIDKELNIAEKLGVNTVRIFFPFENYSSYLIHLQDFVNSRLQLRRMVAIVTLFDFYNEDSSPNRKPYSVEDYNACKAYINTIVSALGSQNENIMAWDIKNEIDRDYGYDWNNDNTPDAKPWLTSMITYLRNNCDSNHLVTIGFKGSSDDINYDPSIPSEFAQYVDFVSMHYFLSEVGFQEDLTDLQDLIGNKPLVLEEFGLHTLADPEICCQQPESCPSFSCTNVDASSDVCDTPHNEMQQAAYFNALLSISQANEVAGYLFWTLTDFSDILDNSQESHHCQGILRNSQVLNCERTTGEDYTEKPAADIIRRHYNYRVHYLDDFYGWVDPKTEDSVPGWFVNCGCLFRGYNTCRGDAWQWSYNEGKAALIRWGNLSVKGIASSPILNNVNISEYPYLIIRVTDYKNRLSNGKHCTLRIGVKENNSPQPTYLFPQIYPTTNCPTTISFDLRRLPWSGNKTFQIVLELVPIVNDGYAAIYELDIIALKSANPSLPWIHLLLF